MIVHHSIVPNRKAALRQPTKKENPIRKSLIVNNRILSRDFSWLVGRYAGEDCFIVAGGASLYGFDFDRLKGKNVIAINHAYQYVDCDILVALDSKFFGEAKNRGHDLQKDYNFKILTGSGGAQRESDKLYMVYMNNKPTTNQPVKLFGAVSSTMIALNAAHYTKAKNIYILGLDGKFTNGMGHFFSKDWSHSGDVSDEKYSRVIKEYDKFKIFKNIINLNPDSEIKVFPFKDVDEVLGV